MNVKYIILIVYKDYTLNIVYYIRIIYVDNSLLYFIHKRPILLIIFLVILSPMSLCARVEY